MGYRAARPLFGMVLLTSVVRAQTPEPAAATMAEPVMAFVHVGVIPMDRERVLTDQTVVVRGRHIVAVGPAKRVAVPAEATRIDGTGKFLIPGLADMHTHGGNWFAFLANGVTTVRMPGGSPGEGAGRRAEVQAARLPGPHVYAFGTVDHTRSPAEMVQGVLAIKAAGDGAIKMIAVGASGEPGAYDSVLAAARRVNLKLVGHLPRGVNLEDVLRSGQWASIEHLHGYVEYIIGVSGHAYIGLYEPDLFPLFSQRQYIDTAAWLRPTFQPGPQLRKIAELTRETGVWNCPTLYAGGLRGLLDAPDSVLVKMGHNPGTIRLAMQHAYDLSAAVAKALQGAGAGLLLGTDGGQFAVQRELELLVQAGLTPYQALATGTRNAADFLGALDSTGTVAKGKLADLVLLDGNPLQDIRQTKALAGVMVAGHWLPRMQIDARLDSLGLKAQRDTEWRRPMVGVGGRLLQ